jgi:type I restriction enzyme M protein
MMENIEALERRLWSVADQLRANSGLGSNEYFMPVLGILFLRHAHIRFAAATKHVEESLSTRGGQKRVATKDDYTKRRSIYLREESQYDYLLNLKGEDSIGQAINNAMDLIEKDYASLKGILPHNYEAFDDDLLKNLIKTFNDEALRKATGDVFGRIYEYFLMKFSMQGAHDNGEFFTPPSIVQTIVNVIEPERGKVFDPACGSGGMFVQTSHFLEKIHKDVSGAVTFYGQEKNETTIKIAKMNLAVHGLEGSIINGNTFYNDEHEMLNKADYVMANPPFNVDGVDADKIKKDPRLPFGLPGVNKSGAVSNGNYLWISYFYSYLNDKGRAGFVMSSQSSSAGHGEAEVRRKLIETGHVDVMIGVRSNFFYTRSVPCELWFLDKGKPKEKLDSVLMIDARNIYRKVTRKIYDFSEEQLNNISAIVWLYRGEKQKYLLLIQEYYTQLLTECAAIPPQLDTFDQMMNDAVDKISSFDAKVKKNTKIDAKKYKLFEDVLSELNELEKPFQSDKKKVIKIIDDFIKGVGKNPPETNVKQIRLREEFDPLSEIIRGFLKQIEHRAKLAVKCSQLVKSICDDVEELIDKNDKKQYSAFSKELSMPKPDANESTLLADTMHPIRQAIYYYKQIHWLQDKFPDAQYCDVEGLVKLVKRKQLKENDWSLTPGRYVGVTQVEEDGDYDFEERLSEIHAELAALNDEAIEIAKSIQENIEELI